MHTESTLVILNRLTTLLGEELRRFRDLFVDLEILETTRECTARRQKDMSRAKKAGLADVQSSSTRRARPFNLCTPKTHFLGDYVAAIRLFGCTDVYSTQKVRQSKECNVLLNNCLLGRT